MKHTFYVLLLVVVAIACGKQEDTAPADAGIRVAGTYDVSVVEQKRASAAQSYTSTFPVTTVFNGVTLTQSAQVEATRKTASSVGITIRNKATGQPDDVKDYGTVEIKGSNLYSGTTVVGSADGTTMVVGVAASGGQLIYTARKK